MKLLPWYSSRIRSSAPDMDSSKIFQKTVMDLNGFSLDPLKKSSFKKTFPYIFQPKRWFTVYKIKFVANWLKHCFQSLFEFPHFKELLPHWFLSAFFSSYFSSLWSIGILIKLSERYFQIKAGLRLCFGFLQSPYTCLWLTVF